MKLKFKAQPQDLLYFVLFCIFLLYVVALAILNLSEFSRTSTFYGLNPLEAFSPEYIAYTIIFYIIAFLGIFLVVSSYFFEREKGVGISTSNKKFEGFEDFAKEKDIMSAIGVKRLYQPDKDYSVGGMPLFSKGNDTWVDDGESHSLVIGATGSGKTYCIVNPLVNILAKKGESMIITDPKGEIYEKNAEMLKERGYKIITLNFRDPQMGHAWNPLTLPYELYKAGNSDKSNELLRDLAINILHEEKTEDPFWQNTAADFFTGLAQGLFQDAKEDEINLNSIILMLTTGEEKFNTSTYIKEYFAIKDPSNPAYINAAGTINAPNETRGSIVSVFRQKVNIFAMAENLSEMLSHSDFNMLDIGKEKTAVFLVIQDEKKTYHALATIFIKQCYESLIDAAQGNGGKLAIRTNFILDEFANMPPLKDVTTMITAARSRLIRFNLIIQNFAQLDQVYGKENAETIKGNCANTIYLLSSELQSLEEISKLAGEKKTKKKDKEEVRPLITVAELQRLKFKDSIILKHRCAPFKTTVKTNDEYNWNMPNYPKATYIKREKQQIKLFDLKEMVKSKKMNNLFGVIDDPMKFNRPSINNVENKQSPFENENFNFDDLIKKIDQKIEELEKEEKEKSLVDSKEEKQQNENVIKEEPKNEPKEEEVIVNPDIDKIIDSIEEEDNTDDQFFDDFFFDE